MFWMVSTYLDGAMLKICWNLLSLQGTNTPSKIDDISRVLAGDDDDIDVPDWGWCPWWHYGWSANALRKLCLKFSWNPKSLKASRTPSKIDDISRVLAGDDDDIDVPDLGWCPWWHYEWTAYVLRELCLKFGWNPMSLKASRTPSKIDDICRFLAGVDDDFDVPDWGWWPLMTFWMVSTCPDGAMFEIWLKFDEFEGIKNPLKDIWHL